MELNRRDFLKLSGAGVGAAVALSVIGSTELAEAAADNHSIPKIVKETNTICCYCSVGCGAVVTEYEDGRIKVGGPGASNKQRRPVPQGTGYGSNSPGGWQTQSIPSDHTTVPGSIFYTMGREIMGLDD
jgi:anaerobic selenocysteine-containing dehydrogenase